MLSLSFAKLVATPTESSWSQVYNAGNLFASLSLSKNAQDEETSLSLIGKEIFSNLSAEFFTLEHKDLDHIKSALLSSMHTVPDSVDANLSLAYFKDNILYLFIYGSGTILMKRGNKIGPLLERTIRHHTDEHPQHTGDVPSHEVHTVIPNEDKIITASGVLQNHDTIIVQTPQFAKDISQDTLSSALDLILPNDIAEALSPGMHEKDDGGQAAIIINYKDALKPVVDDPSLYPDPDEEFENPPFAPLKTPVEPPSEIEHHHEAPTLDENIVPLSDHDVIINDANPAHQTKSFSIPKTAGLSFLSSIVRKLTGGKRVPHLNHRKKLFLTIAVIIFAVLITSILLSKKREADAKTTALFQSIYEPAKNNYEDGLGVKSINKTFARDEFLKSQQILKDGQGQFKKGSKEEKQITELLAKIEQELGGTGGVVIKPKQVDIGANDLLSLAHKTTDVKGITKDETNIYYVTSKAVVSVDSKGTKKDIIENSDDWASPLGIATYQGNMYVLDAEDAVLKYTPGSSGFGKSSYFKSPVPDMSNATSIAIDGSVWILFKDGNIAKYTRGVSDGYKIKGLDKPMRNATRIVTNTDSESVYVLDPSNSRIVEFDKSGNFQTQYTADILKNAKEIDVNEADGKILVLSGGKFYEILL
jgi:hypothetical protein